MELGSLQCPQSSRLGVAILQQGLGPDELCRALPTPATLCDADTTANNNRDRLLRGHSLPLSQPTSLPNPRASSTRARQAGLYPGIESCSFISTSMNQRTLSPTT